MNRPTTTRTLSDLVEKRLRARRMFWAPEVTFDEGTAGERRIDYVAFKPFTPNDVVEPTSVELGTFECYEVKSCMADFQSGHGLTFYGDRNYLVTTREFADELRERMLTPTGIDAVLVPNRPETALLERGSHPEGRGHLYGSQSYRRRVASEMLWRITRSHCHDDTLHVDMETANGVARKRYPYRGPMFLHGPQPIGEEADAFLAGVRWALEGDEND